MDAIDKINVILKARGLSGAELERMIGVSNSVYSQWNTGSTKPSNKSLAKVAEALEVDISEILPDKPAKNKKPATVTGDELRKADIQFATWFRSLSPERQTALLSLGGAPQELLDALENERNKETV